MKELKPRQMTCCTHQDPCSSLLWELSSAELDLYWRLTSISLETKLCRSLTDGSVQVLYFPTSIFNPKKSSGPNDICLSVVCMKNQRASCVCRKVKMVSLNLFLFILSERTHTHTHTQKSSDEHHDKYDCRHTQKKSSDEHHDKYDCRHLHGQLQIYEI